MNKQEIIEAIKKTNIYDKDGDYDLNILSNDTDTFSAGCNSCGKCCRDRNDILLKPLDLYKIHKELNISNYEVIAKYCDTYLGENSELPVISILFRDNIFDDSTVCPFLKKVDNKTYHCRIHKNKPNVCRLYPLGRMCLDKETIYFKQLINCVKPSEEKEYKLNEWLGENYKLEEEFLSTFFSLIDYIYKHININKLWKTLKKKDTSEDFNYVYIALIDILYILKDFDTLEETLEEYKSRTKDLDVLFSIFKKEGYNVIKK